MRRFTKYRNTPQGGYASKKEARRAAELKMLVQVGAISELEEQVTFEIIPKQEGERAAHYRCDFRYRDGETGLLVVEDVKGVKTPAYILKRKLLKLVHGITITEV